MAEAAGFLDYTAISNAVRGAAAQGIAQGVARSTQRALEAIGTALSDTQHANPLMAEANKRLAQAMRTAVLHSYDQTVTAQKRVASYRHGDDRFAGQLRGALESDVNYVADARGIRFIDIQHMDDTAAHWYRLNFGAAPAGGRPPYSYNWEIGGVSLGRLQLSWASSLPFRMPAGTFVNGAFYPSTSTQTPSGGERKHIGRGTLTRGIAPRRFLDAGLDRFSQNFSGVYSDLLIQFKNEAVQGHGALAKTDVSVIVPF